MWLAAVDLISVFMSLKIGILINLKQSSMFSSKLLGSSMMMPDWLTDLARDRQSRRQECLVQLCKN